MQYKNTTRIITLCLVLQIVQNYFPGLENYQACIPSFLKHIPTIPLFLIGLMVHMFSHANWPHLLGNMSIGIPCFMYLENLVGSDTMLESFVLCGIGSALTFMCMPFAGEGLIGASGAIFGCLAMCCALTKHSVLGFTVLGLFMIPQLMALNLGPFAGNVAYAGHVGGMVTGLLLAILHLKASRQAP